MEKKVLIIDDEPEMLKVLSYALEKAGFKIATCDNGRRAWDDILAQNPDLLLLDVMLPGIDGYSLQQKISETPETKNIPVIVMTSLEPAKALFQKFPQVISFMSKPCDIDELIRQARKATGQPTNA
jgi:DNA-binding response OmpR family regulator